MACGAPICWSKYTTHEAQGRILYVHTSFSLNFSPAWVIQSGRQVPNLLFLVNSFICNFKLFFDVLWLLYYKQFFGILFQINKNKKSISISFLEIFFDFFQRGCLKRRDVYVAVWPRGRAAEIIEPLYKYYKKFKLL